MAELVFKMIGKIGALFFVLFSGVVFADFEMVVESRDKISKNIKLMPKNIIFNINKNIVDKTLYVIGVQKEGELYKYKIEQKISDRVYILSPTSDFKSSEVCPEICSGSLLQLNPREEMEIYYKFRPLPANKNQEVFKNLFGKFFIQYGMAGTFSNDDVENSSVSSYGLNVELFLTKKYTKKFLYGFTSGLNIELNKVNFNKMKFSYIDENLDEATLINFSVPLSLHFMPIRFIDIFLGLDFNASLLTYTNETSDDEGLSNMKSLNGGFSIGLHAGISILIDKYVFLGRISNYSIPMSENEDYEIKVNGQIVNRSREEKHYEISATQLFIGFGIKF